MLSTNTLSEVMRFRCSVALTCPLFSSYVEFFTNKVFAVDFILGAIAVGLQ